MIGNLEGRLAALEESMPDGYKTLDQNGNIVIDSPLSTLDWMLWAERTLGNGTSAERKEILRGQLARSVREPEGGHVFELIKVMDFGPYVPKTSCEMPKESSGAKGSDSDFGSVSQT